MLISSYLPELINLCDRIVVLRDGRIAGELKRDEFVGGADHGARDGRGNGGRMSTTRHHGASDLRCPSIRDRMNDVALAAGRGRRR